MAPATAPTSLAIGVDLGGTHVLAALVDPSGHVHARQEVKIAEGSRGSHDTIGEALSGCILAVWRCARERHAEALPIRGVGIAVPGNIDPTRGVARYLPNFGWLEPVDLAALVLDREAESGSKTTLREVLGVERLHLRNDGRCAALAERHFGVGASDEHGVMAMLTLGTGIGGALVHDPAPPSCQGVLFDGTSFDAGDFGHHVMRSGPDAFACVCGKAGCFETHASAAGLVRHWRACVTAHGGGGDADSISLDDARSVVQRCREGDPAATAAFTAYRSDLATGLANLVTFYNPSLIVLGGGLSRTPELYDGLQEEVDGNTLPATRGKCETVQSTLGGGNAANAAVAASRLRSEGAPAVRLISKLGADAHGAALRSELERDGVDTRWIARARDGHATSASVVLVVGDSRSIVHEPGLTRSDPLLPADFEGEGGEGEGGEGGGKGGGGDGEGGGGGGGSPRPAWLSGASLILLDGRHPLAAIHAARRARAWGVGVLLDVERPREGLIEMMSLADYVVSSEDFPHKLAAGGDLGGDEGQLNSDEGKAAFVLARCANARWVCLTLGSRGALLLERGSGGSGGRVIRAPAWPLPASGPGSVRDTTGAGDAFIGAMCEALRRGLEMEDGLRLATYVAGANCGADGARGGMPRHAELPRELRSLLSDAPS